MNARLRLLLAAACVAAYTAAPALLRPLFPLLANPVACAQRAQSVAQAVMRVPSLAHYVRRPS